jgi:hypothetical protein
MNRALVNRIADAVLYEGYILYPYRPSIKNHQRWTFGGLYPEAYCQATNNGETSRNQTECLVCGTAATTLEAVVRFLHLTDRLVGEILSPLAEWPPDGEPPFRLVPSLRVGEQSWHAWQEAEEREVSLGDVTLGELVAAPRCVPFRFPGGRRSEPVRDTAGVIGGVLIRQQQAVAGTLEIRAVAVAAELFRLTCRVVNTIPLPGDAGRSREEALLCCLVSTHTLLGVRGGAFVSLLDPPARWSEAAAACQNIGTWPVLIGAEGQTADTMLSSPIILYDYPQVAAESPGNFFDGTEIDEMLTLRILTLTDEEKLAMTAVDERARDLLLRTETMAEEQFRGLHGAIRAPRTLPEESAHG